MNGTALRSNWEVGARAVVVAFVLQVVLLAAAQAQPAGVVATMEGTVEIGRAGVWAPAVVGSNVEVGDVIRTGTPGRVRISLRDESVVNLGDASEMAVDEHVYDASAGEARSVLELLNGKVRAIVSEHYKEPKAAFEIKTVTAVSGVRGTDFVVVHDRDTALTQVVGVSGLVDVNGSIDPEGHGVVVGPQEITEVVRGRYPTPPRRLDETTFRQYLDGLEFIGFGAPESLLFDNPIFDGEFVPPADRLEGRAGVEPPGGAELPAGGIGAAEPPWEQPDVSDLIDQPPAAAGGGGEVGIEF
jgi:hypothetical protein